MNFFYLSFMGNTIDMNIKNRHKDADFHARAFIKSTIINQTRKNNLSISRRNNASGIIGDNAIRISEKIADKKGHGKTRQRQRDESQKREYSSCKYRSKYKRIPSACQWKGRVAGYVRPNKVAHLVCPG